MPTKGFITMTFDIPHKGHIRRLRKCKALCDTLVVGLTTDARCASRKRTPIYDYAHRYEILSSLSFVDCVIEDAGEPKSLMIKKYGFDVIFTGEEYINDPEYTTLEDTDPNVCVVYLKRTNDVSTTDTIAKLSRLPPPDLKPHIVAIGITGIVTRIGSKVFKPVALGKREVDAKDGADTYGIAVPPPRNWKRGNVVVNHFPMISGVNGHREIISMKRLKGRPWNPYIDSYLTYTSQATHKFVDNVVDNAVASNAVASNDAKIVQNIVTMQAERQRPSAIYYIEMEYRGKTMYQYLTDIPDAKKRKDELDRITDSVCVFIREMNSLLVLHGDLHPNNVCISAGGDVSFIDFGWSICADMKMTDEERAYFNECLVNGFDVDHFMKSLESFGF